MLPLYVHAWTCVPSTSTKLSGVEIDLDDARVRITVGRLAELDAGVPLRWRERGAGLRVDHSRADPTRKCNYREKLSRKRKQPVTFHRHSEEKRTGWRLPVATNVPCEGQGWKNGLLTLSRRLSAADLVDVNPVNDRMVMLDIPGQLSGPRQPPGLALLEQLLCALSSSVVGR